MTSLRWIFFWLFVYSNSFSQSPQWCYIHPEASLKDFPWQVVSPHLTADMVTRLQKHPLVSSHRDPIQVFWVNNKIWAVFPCRLSVLEWRQSEWVDLYKGYSAGFNCQAQFFVRQGILHSYGRYGYWRTHSEIMVFDPQAGGWENLQGKHMPPFYAGVGAYLDGNRFLTLMGQHIHQSSGLFDYEPHGYYYSFTERTWYPLHSSVTVQPKHFDWLDGRVFDLPKVGIQHFDYEAELGLLVLDKQNLTLHFGKVAYEKFDEFAIAMGIGNRLLVWDARGQETALDFSGPMPAPFKTIGQLELVTHHGWFSSLTYTQRLVFYSIIALIFLVLLGWWMPVRRKNTTKIQDSALTELETDEVQLALGMLLAHPASVLEVEAFDSLLQLDAIENVDYRRVRRSRLIKSLNEFAQETWGHDIVVRTKSPEDRRLMRYQLVRPDKTI